ncbi:hypothetical protein CTEN210_03822 [Chaetoceros tenuissimus]|uniref:Uncharacterized protein n=1 Tax=Chaetoceros tenuissimus TaxID=426638 RepID=A0AAD3CJT7_9STRA|nr:hypothetical protein CTEN210_03822 [Chaetoceros tenuissimus]
MSGQFLRLNGEMLNRGDGQGGIFSIVGECLAFDGETITLKAADGVEIQFLNQGGLDLQMGSFIEVMGAHSEEGNQAFIARELGSDFDLSLYNELLTKVIPTRSQYFA